MKPLAFANKSWKQEEIFQEKVMFLLKRCLFMLGYSKVAFDAAIPHLNTTSFDYFSYLKFSFDSIQLNY